MRTAPLIWFWRGGSAQPPWMQTPLTPRLLPNRMTDASENITLPQTSFAGGNNEDDRPVEWL